MESTERPPARASNLVFRLLTAAVAVPLLLALLYLAPKWIFAALLACAAAVSAAELLTMVAPRDRASAFYAAVASAAVCASVMTSQLIAAAALGVPLLGLLFGLARPNPIESAHLRLPWLVAAPAYAGGCLGSLGALFLRPAGDGPGWVVLALALAWLSDTGGYLVGRSFGRHPLYSLVSPKKTIEGSFGGALGGVSGAILAHAWYLPSLPIAHACVLGVVGALLGQAGDLCESLIKRGAGVKDSGRLLPGHGGILDRIDALLFTSAATWVYATWVHG